jgi:hypothetical protein
MRRSQPGFLKTYAAAQSVRSEPVIAYDYYLSTFQQKTDGRPLYLLSPAKIPDAVQKLLPNLDHWSVAGYHAGTLGNKIYSDMGSRSIDRGAAEAIMTAALSKLAGKSKLQLSAANAYAFYYADTITDVPLYTSGYLIEHAGVAGSIVDACLHVGHSVAHLSGTLSHLCNGLLHGLSQWTVLLFIRQTAICNRHVGCCLCQFAQGSLGVVRLGA